MQCAEWGNMKRMEGEGVIEWGFYFPYLDIEWAKGREENDRVPMTLKVEYRHLPSWSFNSNF